MLNIVIPMAGMGSRFQVAGFKEPKPLISIFDQPMIKLVIDNLRPKIEHRFLFICQNSHIEEWNLRNLLKQWAPGSIIVGIDGLTEGAACTVLKAANYINNIDPLMIANSDQFLNFSIDKYLEIQHKKSCHGLIMTMKAMDPKWSFIKRNSDGDVIEVKEKMPISNEATVGIYNFKEGKFFVQASKSMIEKNIRTNNEFYVAPVYNEMIQMGQLVCAHNVGLINQEIFGIGTPEDLRFFIEKNKSPNSVFGK